MDNTQTNTMPQNKLDMMLQTHPVILQLLRFAAIGFLNTALTFVVYNYVSKLLGIEQGGSLGLVSGLGFLLATCQSYFWNRHWTFGSNTWSILQNFWRLLLVGTAGVLTLVLVLLGSKATAPSYYYLFILAIFVIAQIVLWFGFGFNKSPSEEKNPYLSFFIVSLVGFLINVSIVATFSSAVHLTTNPDLNKNVAQVVATAVALIWNFLGFKLIVFKK